jgi:hypothetical protein
MPAPLAEWHVDAEPHPLRSIRVGHAINRQFRRARRLRRLPVAHFVEDAPDVGQRIDLGSCTPAGNCSSSFSKVADQGAFRETPLRLAARSTRVSRGQHLLETDDALSAVARSV